MPIRYFYPAENPRGWAWYGLTSECHHSGAIVRFVRDTLNKYPNPIILAIPSLDGFAEDEGEARLLGGARYISNFYRERTDTFVVGALCTQNFDHPSLILLPFDDDSFEKGVIERCREREGFQMIDWKQKQSIAIWRGGGTHTDLRSRLYDYAKNYPFIDAKLTAWEVKKPIGNRTLVPSMHIRDQLYYKYILIVDGNCIASSLQWTFASGSVPILITHPGNNWWFKRYLIPMVHYVPIEYDLSDLAPKIKWLIENDDKAEQIAKNAYAFAEYYLSAGFQKYHLFEEIKAHFA